MEGKVVDSIGNNNLAAIRDTKDENQNTKDDIESTLPPLYDRGGWFRRNQYKCLSEAACVVRDLVPPTIFFRSMFQKESAGPWKSCSLITFRNMHDILVLDKLPEMLREEEGKGDKDLIQPLIANLEELRNAMQLRVTYVKLSALDILEVKSRFWIRGPDVVQQKILQVLVPPHANVLLSLLCVTEKLLNEIIAICSQWQMIVVNQNLEIKTNVLEDLDEYNSDENDDHDN